MFLKHAVPTIPFQMNLLHPVRTLCARFASLLRGLALLALLMAAPVPAQEAAGGAVPRFDILEYAIEGNSKLTDLEIERAVTPFLGESRTVREVEAARAALEKAYQDSGFLTVLVAIPEQDVGSGVVTLKVTEGEVERLRVRGAEYHLSSDIRDRMPELAAGNVPYFPQVQRELEALNRGPDLKATPVLKPGRAPGTVAVQLDVEDNLPLHGSIDFSNRQSANTTPQRLAANLRFDNLFQLRHSAALTLQTSPQNAQEVRVAALTYVMPSGTSGAALALYTVLSRSNLATLAGSPGLGLLGNTRIYGVRYALPLRGAGAYSHSLSVGIDYKDVKQQSVAIGGSQLNTPISYAPLIVAYNGGWLGDGRSTLVDASSAIGLNGLLGNRDAEFAARRIGARASFATLRAGVRHTERAGRWTFSGRLDAQFATGPLVSNEQFVAGGAESVRGYLESERASDAGLRYSLEARSPTLLSAGGADALKVNGVAFVEGASLRTFEPVFPTPAWRLLRGAGLGLRVTGLRGLSLDVDWARALTDGDLTRAGDNRFHIRLLWEI